ncbi:transcription antitermination factor NusB [Anaeroselena agilis]|uniref:Transcription antitermination protein NusB n=1 Tax=Anaeroselena agilis TaxID=3063788 RepID=A0ABU3NW80_9FIRM|nr:transcription antitermination factor NusB [Selenomonadales bacterium 4137-cl]
MSRRKAREMALQTLYQLDFNATEPEQALATAVEEAGEPDAKTMDYAWALVSGANANRTAIDEIIAGASTEWKLDRMASVDRNIARIAIYEMRFGSEPLTPNVVINEAVELAKTFGTEESSRFVNGILGSLVKKKGAT